MRRGLRHLPRIFAFAMMIAVASAASVMASSQSATVTVSMSVPSNITLTNNCVDPTAHEFGTIQPGSTALTATGATACSFQFQSSNDTAMIRIGQRDGTGTAMGSPGDNKGTLQGTNGTPMTAVSAANSSVVVAAGYADTIMRSTNGGTSWLDQSIGTDDHFDVDNVPGNPDRFFTVDGNGDVWRTTNATAGTPTWTQLSITGWPAVTPRGIAVVDQDTVWVAGDDGNIAVSNNADLAAGSVTWTVIIPTSLGGSTPDFEAIDASSATHIIAAGDGGWACRNTTGGTGAGDFACTDLGGPWWKTVSVDSNTNAVVGGHRGGLAWWDGATWNDRSSNIAFPGTVNSVAIDPSTPATGWAGGTHGQVVRTTDSGVTWTPVDYDDAVSVKGLHAPTSSTLFATSSGKNIQKSTDGGLTWAMQNQQVDSEEYHGIDSLASDGQTVVAVDSNGGIDRSTDLGASWTPLASPTTQPLFDVQFASAGRAWAVGHAGTILTSTDSGATWSAQTSGTTERLYAIDTASELEAYASATNGRVYRTRNGGAAWTELTTTTTNTLANIARSPQTGTLIATGGYSTVVRSIDDGDTWTTISGGDIPAATRPIVMLTSNPEGTFYAASYGDSNEVWKSEDDGLTWVELDGLIPTSLASIDSPKDGVLWAGDTGTDMWHSTDDSGVGTEYTFSGEQLMAITAVDVNTAIAAGTRHHITRNLPVAGATELVSDYANGATDWDTAGTTNMFGVCLQAIGVSTTADPAWTVDGDGTCTTVDGPEWSNVPTGVSKLGYTGSAGDIGQVDLVWGVRTRDDQAEGTYFATVVFEAVAPDV